MGLMNAIGLQPRHPTTSVTSQGTQTLAPQLQNAETQTEREVQELGAAASGSGEGEGPEYGPGGEDALTRIQRLMAEGGMTAVVQREQSTTMASMGGFGNNIIVSHRIHRSSQTGTEPGPSDSVAPQPSTSRGLAPEPGDHSLLELEPLAERGLSQRTGPARLASPSTVGPISYGHLTNNNHLSDSTGCPSGEPRDR